MEECNSGDTRRGGRECADIHTASDPCGGVMRNTGSPIPIHWVFVDKVSDGGAAPAGCPLRCSTLRAPAPLARYMLHLGPAAFARITTFVLYDRWLITPLFTSPHLRTNTQ
ncbi:uncharacterized protein LOC113521438 isoform X3 [Galleria mellonella]|uniref:Uncharacterized protein LOC113521438 isoform X3 n=1 Tax=Galleria mellonella TaxID=7137 RepID=A0ABM3MUD8_GALME|nr:uncharacterized protein LOC113521438 isoform X3 [Galleria mellonella]